MHVFVCLCVGKMYTFTIQGFCSYIAVSEISNLQSMGCFQPVEMLHPAQGNLGCYLGEGTACQGLRDPRALLDVAHVVRWASKACADMVQLTIQPLGLQLLAQPPPLLVLLLLWCAAAQPMAFDLTATAICPTYLTHKESCGSGLAQDMG